MKKNILLLTFLATLINPCLAQEQTFGKTYYSGPKVKPKYWNWSFFACCEIVHQTGQCVWVTRYLTYQDPTKPVDCCQDTLAPPYNHRCLGVSILQYSGPFLLYEVWNIRPICNYYALKETKSHFYARPFQGPYIAYDTQRNQWIIVFGVSFFINYWKDRSITIYYFDPYNNMVKVETFSEDADTPFYALYPI